MSVVLAFVLLSTMAGAEEGEAAWNDDVADASEDDVTEEEEAIARSRARFANAVDLVDQGRHGEALELFQELQNERPHPIILYNIGLCLSRLDRVDEAIEILEEYLEQGDPDEGRLAAARAELDRLGGLATASPPPIEPVTPPTIEESSSESQHPREDAPASAERRDRRRLRPVAFWTVFGLTAATGVSLAITGGLTLHLSDQWLEEGHVEDRNTGRVLRGVSDGLLIALVVESIAALVLGLFTDYGDSREQRPVALLAW
jgi:hypothetical protein